MALIERFPTQAIRGQIVFIGNTLGLSKAQGALSAGTMPSIGAFISLDTGQQLADFPPGTTDNYVLNGSNAVLDLPQNSRVLYAELLWGATATSGSQDVSSSINNAVQLTTPTGIFSVLPDPAMSVFTTSGSNAYGQSAIVTDLVGNGGPGLYAVSQVPGVLNPSADQYVFAGWTLAVIFEQVLFPLRFVTLEIGEIEASDSPITLTDFVTPQVGNIRARFLESLTAGSANVSDQQRFNGLTISGPNNPGNNFACSQINNALGQLDTRGTFGDRNQQPATFMNVSAGRQGWDITNVDVSALLTNGQTSVTFDPLPAPDSQEKYAVRAIGFQVNLPNPDIVITQLTAVSEITVGDVVTYDFVVINIGALIVEDVVFHNPLVPNTSYVPNSLTVAGQPVDADPAVGIPIGSISPANSIRILFQIRIDGRLTESVLINTGFITFEFEPAVGFSDIPDTSVSNTAILPFIFADLTMLLCEEPTIQLGEQIDFSVFLVNQGTAVLNDIVISNLIPANTSFVPDSVTLNGTPVANANPQAGISAGSLLVLGISQLDYLVDVTFDSFIETITNQVTGAFTYKVGERTLQGNAVSNVSTAQIARPVTLSIEIVNPPDTIVVNETVQLEVDITNLSIINLQRVLFTVTLSNDSVVIVPGSFTINGIPAREALNSIIIRALLRLQTIRITFALRALFQPQSGSVSGLLHALNPDAQSNTSFTLQVEEHEE